MGLYGPGPGSQSARTHSENLAGVHSGSPGQGVIGAPTRGLIGENFPDFVGFALAPNLQII